MTQLQKKLLRREVMKDKWKVIDCATDGKTPTCWAKQINHPVYGKYVWINAIDSEFSVEVDDNGFDELIRCKSLVSAKRWVSMNLVK